MRKPKRLRPGDTIGIVAPASPIKPDELERGVQLLEARGYRVVLGDHVPARLPTNDYLAGSDEQRAADLHALFAREGIAAIFCACGGYGSMRLLPRLDRELLTEHPKIFVGYSDITSLHLALNGHADMVTFHGPMVMTLPKLDATSASCFWRLLEVPEPAGVLPTEHVDVQTLVAGSVEGELAGGCLCLLAHACGSRFAPDFRGKIVLIEDTHEAIYRADRDLIQLRNAGQLGQAAGFVVGTLSHWSKQEADPPRNSPKALWQDILYPLGKPTIINFPFGHEPNPLTLPLGVRARLDTDAKTLTLLDSAVY